MWLERSLVVLKSVGRITEPALFPRPQLHTDKQDQLQAREPTT